MASKADIRRAIKALASPKLHDALVTSAPLVDGKSAGYVIATVAGQAGVRVAVSPDQQPPVTPGDSIRVQEYGSASAASYGMVDRVAGARADSGRWTFSQETIVNGEVYEPGDQLLGSPMADMPNWYYDFSEGIWYQRIGTTIYGYDSATGDRLWGPETGVNFFYDASESSIIIRNQTTEIARIDGDTLSMVGFQRFGYTHGPAIEMGVIADEDENGDPVLVGGVQQRRYYMKVIGEQGLPIVSILSGTEDDPNNAAFLINKPGSTEYFEWKNGALSLSGTINATDGTIGGWDIKTNRLESTNGKVALVSTADADFAEGLSMLCAVPSNAGAIKWLLTEVGSDKSMGIDFTYIDESTSPMTVVKQSQVSSVEIGGAVAELRWVAGHYGGNAHTLKFDGYGNLTLEDNMYLKAKYISGSGGPSDPNLQLTNIEQVVWIPGTAIAPISSDGTVMRTSNYNGYAYGPVGQLLTNAKEAVLPLSIPYQHLGAQVYVTSMELHWRKTIDAAYFTSVILAYFNTTTHGKVAGVTVSNLGSGTVAGYYESELLSANYQMINAPYNLCFLPTGMVTPPEIEIAGLRVTYVTQ